MRPVLRSNFLLLLAEGSLTVFNLLAFLLALQGDEVIQIALQ
jgi:hypothetical protein